MRWTRPQTWHLTLLFLGSVAPDHVGELEQLIGEVAGVTEPYPVTADQGGGRTRHEAGVAWLGLSEGAGTLIRTATLTADGCPADITDGKPAKRTPAAHLTIARNADETVVQALRDQRRGRLSVGWDIDRIQLVRSHLSPAGARYETLYEATM